MKVLHVYRTYYPDTQGGLQEVIRQICLCTIPHGIESRVATLCKNPLPPVVEMTESTVYRFPLSFEIASCGFSTGFLSGFKQLIRWADLIHYHFPWPFADLMHFFAKPDKPYIVTYHSDIVRQRLLGKIYQPLMHHFLSHADRIIATSQNYLESSPILQDYLERAEVIPIGLATQGYIEPSDDQVEEMRNLAGDGFFLFIGVLRYYKGLHYLLEAVATTNLPVVIVGSGPEEKKLKRRAAELSLQYVRFLGHVSDQQKLALIELSKAIVFPSFLRSEAYGVTLLEGAMHGKPLITAKIDTGTSYINQDQKTGFEVPPADPIKLREAMNRLHEDSGLVERMGAAAKQRFHQLFTGEQMGKRYAQLYKSFNTSEL